MRPRAFSPTASLVASHPYGVWVMTPSLSVHSTLRSWHNVSSANRLKPSRLSLSELPGSPAKPKEDRWRWSPHLNSQAGPLNTSRVPATPFIGALCVRQPHEEETRTKVQFRMSLHASWTSSETWKAMEEDLHQRSLPSGHQQSDLTVQPARWHRPMWSSPKAPPEVSNSSFIPLSSSFEDQLPSHLWTHWAIQDWNHVAPLPPTRGWLYRLVSDLLFSDVTSVYLHSIPSTGFLSWSIIWSCLVTSDQSTSPSLLSVGKPCSLFETRDCNKSLDATSYKALIVVSLKVMMLWSLSLVSTQTK